MATAPPLLSIEEYLHTSYRPDVHFVDGEIEERNVGEFTHSTMQSLISFIFNANEESWATTALVEQRIRINSSRVRICDVVILGENSPYEEVTSTPPLICIEIMSPEDCLARAEHVLADYFALGVPNIWLIDPYGRKAYVFDAKGLQQNVSGRFSVSATPIRLDINEVFAKLDRKIASLKSH